MEKRIPPILVKKAVWTPPKTFKMDLSISLGLSAAKVITSPIKVPRTPTSMEIEANV
jgi:hypothetical protein